MKSKERNEQVNKIKYFMKNPGMFCLTVVGSRGTGKIFSIKKAYKEIKKENDPAVLKELRLQKIKYIDTQNFTGDLNKLISENIFKAIVFEDIDRISEDRERELFRLMETKNGKFGKNKDIEVRFIFTSSRTIEDLREDGNIFNGWFWDRISQLIVKMPSYQDNCDFIMNDFKSVWKKMNFQKIIEYSYLADYPKNASLEKFIEDYGDKFEGGFRDLDKLASMYFNYRILHYEKNNTEKISEDLENEVVKSIKEDFINLSQLKGVSDDHLNTFIIKEGFSMNELNSQFKAQVREWGRKKYKTIKKTEEKLGLKSGTMKNYKK